MTQDWSPERLDKALRDIAAPIPPAGLAGRILDLAPQKPDPWSRFKRPLLAGPALALSMLMGVTVGYAAPSLAAQDTEIDETLELAFEVGLQRALIDADEEGS